MIKLLNRLLCNHEKVFLAGTILVKQDDGSWKTEHNGNAENAERRLRNEKSISLVDFVSRNYRRFICWGIPDVYKGDFDCLPCILISDR